MLGGIQFYALTFVLVGLLITDWAVTKLYGTRKVTLEHTWLRTLYPPATEEEYLMAVQDVSEDCKLSLKQLT